MKFMNDEMNNKTYCYMVFPLMLILKLWFLKSCFVFFFSFTKQLILFMFWPFLATVMQPAGFVQLVTQVLFSW